MLAQGVALFLWRTDTAEALEGRYILPFQGFGCSAFSPQGFALWYWI